jgi:hypothetical protein
VEIATHAPGIAVGIPNNPIWQIFLFVKAPADQENCVVKLLGGHFGARLGEVLEWLIILQNSRVCLDIFSIVDVWNRDVFLDE